jgi:hypothetical protein
MKYTGDDQDQLRQDSDESTSQSKPSSGDPLRWDVDQQVEATRLAELKHQATSRGGDPCTEAGISSWSCSEGPVPVKEGDMSEVPSASSPSCSAADAFAASRITHLPVECRRGCRGEKA